MAMLRLGSSLCDKGFKSLNSSTTSKSAPMALYIHPDGTLIEWELDTESWWISKIFVSYDRTAGKGLRSLIAAITVARPDSTVR